MASKSNNQRYRHSKTGLITRIYDEQLRISKKKAYSLPDYTRDQLAIWMNSNGLDDLYQTWIQSKYDKPLTPSCDRIDIKQPFTLNNLRLITYHEVLQNRGQDTRNRYHNYDRESVSKRVAQYTLEEEHIANYPSTMEASRATNTSHSYISDVCNGKFKSAKGYIWKFI